MENEFNIVFGKSVITEKHVDKLFSTCFRILCKELPSNQYFVHCTKNHFIVIRILQKVPRLGNFKAFRILVIRNTDNHTEEDVDFIFKNYIKSVMYRNKGGEYHVINNTLIIDTGCIITSKNAIVSLLLIYLANIRKILKLRKTRLKSSGIVGVDKVDALCFNKNRPPFAFGHSVAADAIFGLDNSKDNFTWKDIELIRATDRWKEINPELNELPVQLTIKWP